MPTPLAFYLAAGISCLDAIEKSKLKEKRSQPDRIATRLTSIDVRSGKPDSDYLDSSSFFCRSRIFSR